MNPTPEHQPDLTPAADDVAAPPTSLRPTAEAAARAALAQIDELSGQLEQVTLENEGLAEEVLQNYEQLGLLFDVAKQVAEVTQTEALERLLLTRLGALLHVPTIDIACSDGGWRTCDVQAGAIRRRTAPVSPALDAAATDALRNSAATVKRIADQTVLICPLSRFEDEAQVAVIAHPAGGAEFTAGNIRVCEALLTFGGNLINNSKLHDRMRRMSMEATRALVFAIDKKDRYTSGHSQRVGHMSRLTGAEMGLPPEQLTQLEWSGLLHDIGKIGVPEDILNKPGKLTDEEFEIIKRHPQMGYDILAPIKAFEHVLGGVLHHHENEDGSGYPHGLRADDIPLFGRVIHVVDVFDALSSTRSYRQAFSLEKALGIVRELSADKMKGEITEAFAAALDNFRREQPQEFAALFPHVQENAE